MQEVEGEQECLKLNNATVAISGWEKYALCIMNARIGKCSKCSASQRLDKCAMQVTATLVVSSNLDDTTYSLQAYQSMIEAIIVQKISNGKMFEEEIVDALLMAEPFIQQVT